jgi:hypothetical protein
MLSFGSSVRLAAAVAACAFVAPVYADAPPISLTVSATGAAGSFGKNVQVNATSTSASGVGTYIGSAAGTNGTSSIWNCNYNFTANSTADHATESGSLSLTNTSGSDLAFALTMSLPVSANPSQFTGLFSGSASAALVTSTATAGSGLMAPVGAAPLWVATTGSTQIATLFNIWSPVTRSTPGVTFIGSQSFGSSQPSVPAASFGTNIAFTFNFMLSAGATASFSTSLAGVGIPVPAPGALAVLGAAGLGARRRRR